MVSGRTILALTACLATSAGAATSAGSLDALARDRRFVFVGNAGFDPLEGLPSPPIGLAELGSIPSVIPRGAVPDEIVSLVQASTRPALLARRLDAEGIAVTGFVANGAYVVRLPRARLPELRALDGVRWAGEFAPAWKVGDDVAEAVMHDDAGRAAAPAWRVRVAFHRGASTDLHADLLAAIPGSKVVALVPREERGTAVLDVAGGALRGAVVRLAAMRDVASVELVGTARPLIDHAVWWLQTGDDVVKDADYSQSAKLFARGITGRGTVVALFDEGLENDACQFAFAPESREVAWPVVPNSMATGAVPEEHSLASDAAPLRTRDRRVVAYVNESNSVYSSPTQHGAMMAEAILGDDPTSLAARPLVRDIGDLQNVQTVRPGGEWRFGDELRPDLAPLVDDPATDDPRVPNTFGAGVEHHQPGDGIAPGAQLVMMDVGNEWGDILAPLAFADVLDQVKGLGASVVVFGYGFAPCTDCYAGDATTADSEAFRSRETVFVAPVGNDGALGPGRIAAGVAQAKSTITVGATMRADAPSMGTPRLGEDVADYSSLGPSSGGRMTPELMMPGELLLRSGPGQPVQPECGELGCGAGDYGCGLASMAAASGTSFAAAVAAGAAALVQQYFLDGFYPTGVPSAAGAFRPTNALVRAVLANSTRDLGGARTDDTHAGRAHRPSFGQGWGAPRLDDTLYFAGDPVRGGTPERARLLVLNDVPNGFDGAYPPTPEPGGSTRNAVIAQFRPAVVDGAVHEFGMNVRNPDPASPANEVRVTLAWTDHPGTSRLAPLVSDLDLEVVSPGPDGILQTARGIVGGDDIVFRPDRSAWSDGYTQPSSTRAIAPTADPASVDFTDRDVLNTLENVFVPAADVHAGTWLVRVIGRRVPMPYGGYAYPDFAAGDAGLRVDTDGDGIADAERADIIYADKQGYALIASGGVSPGVVPVLVPRVPRGGGGPRTPREPRGRIPAPR